MIEATERGVTISKSLAWTIITGILVGGIWFGKEQSQTLSMANNALEAVKELKVDLGQETRMRDGLGQRIRDIELAVTRQDERLGLILNEISKLSTKLDQLQENRFQK